MTHPDDDRPFPLEHLNGPFLCASCATMSVGPYLAAVDRLGWIAGTPASIVAPGDLVWCDRCVRDALEAA